METEAKEMIDPNVPSFDEFKARLVKIHAEGDLKLSYQRMLWYFENVKIDDKPLTWEFLLGKFKQHIDQWNLLYGNRIGTNYFPTSSLALRKNFYDFLGAKFYEREFITMAGQSERNNYLFGDFTVDYLKNQLKEFKNTIPNETS